MTMDIVVSLLYVALFDLAIVFAIHYRRYQLPSRRCENEISLTYIEEEVTK
jgi:hypothetical protein